ncbi:polyprenol phosphomannose-dependent alpha 1,6 mannosyltransferase MptB [Streptomyces sp. ISL-96]|uniref:polyprenol phosphomannose-dependent alpha 1,6 mannosyltransferase MptB n=1 Tax=Streptomyces sp. ISL-96 TaxID=2819191 RepID=UPI001BED293C|nr:polyprenol phosphomannose-dependent alpha 1,6 mannosyltransferase MptB [Streptomyces sp. ISL-96]MBT2493501.1 polyprenol phosphomannose-dependent alpha 1,6 mannosyltransferase MptB [Streptomyces sp. ISL-96]
MGTLSAVGYRRLGAIGSVAVAVGGIAAGRLPARDPWGIWVPHGSATTVAAAVLAYLGLTLLVVSWWRYGRLVARGAAGGVRETVVTLVWWAAPLVLAPPLHSADVYSYIAQGAMVVEGHDVYTSGPSVLGPDELGADAAASSGAHWTDTPAPYGPVFLVLAKWVVLATGGQIVPAVFGMRLVALAALALIVWATLRIARSRGANETGALWLGALNPLLLIHVVGGIHNDGLMIALMLAGVVGALHGRWVLGSALVALAMMVKSPAAVALLFIGALVVRRTSGPLPWRVVKAFAVPGLVAGAVAVATTLLSGTGFGWLRTQGVAGTIHTALSVSSDIGLGIGKLTRVLFGWDPDPVKSAFQTLGLVLALAVIGYAALATFRSVRPWRGEPPLHPVHALGVALLALVVLSPMVQPWYLLWGVAAISATAWDGRLGRIIAVLSAALVFETHPTGSTPAYGFAIAAGVCVLGAVLMRMEDREPRTDDRPAIPSVRRPSSPANLPAMRTERTERSEKSEKTSSTPR